MKFLYIVAVLWSDWSHRLWTESVNCKFLYWEIKRSIQPWCFSHISAWMLECASTCNQKAVSLRIIDCICGCYYASECFQIQILFEHFSSSNFQLTFLLQFVGLFCSIQLILSLKLNETEDEVDTSSMSFRQKLGTELKPLSSRTRVHRKPNIEDSIPDTIQSI